jgi:hypothetical protein
VLHPSVIPSCNGRGDDPTRVPLAFPLREGAGGKG